MSKKLLDEHDMTRLRSEKLRPKEITFQPIHFLFRGDKKQKGKHEMKVSCKDSLVKSG